MSEAAGTTEEAVGASRQRLTEMRRRMLTEINEIFADLLAATEDDAHVAALMSIASRFEKERDAARARISELESELRSRPRLTTKQEHIALFQDAAVTLRNAMKGLTEAPMTDVGSARVIGQVNKAVVAFDDVTKGMAE